MRELFDLSNKTAIITGGSRGIGAMIARELVANGVITYITSRTAEECESTAKELSKLGSCFAICADMTKSEGIAALAAEFGEREQQLNILINNAGMSLHMPIDEYSESGWDGVQHINMKAPFFVTQRLLGALKRAGTAEDPARVINISTFAALKALPTDNYAYTTSKAGLNHLTRHLAIRLAPEHITVNSLSLGVFRTSQTSHWLDRNEKGMTENIPLRRLGTPEDIASAVIYLSSRAGAWLTGVNIPIDGGQSL